jgi:hypothetical protein
VAIVVVVVVLVDSQEEILRRDSSFSCLSNQWLKLEERRGPRGEANQGFKRTRGRPARPLAVIPACSLATIGEHR